MIYYAWFLLIGRIIVCLIPGQIDTTNTQTTRMIGLLMFLPLVGRVLGWW